MGSRKVVGRAALVIMLVWVLALLATWIVAVKKLLAGGWVYGA